MGILEDALLYNTRLRDKWNAQFKEIKAWSFLVDLSVVVRDLVDVLEAAEGGRKVVSNQGQALDGYSELANYRAVAKKARILWEKANGED